MLNRTEYLLDQVMIEKGKKESEILESSIKKQRERIEKRKKLSKTFVDKINEEIKAFNEAHGTDVQLIRDYHEQTSTGKYGFYQRDDEGRRTGGAIYVDKDLLSPKQVDRLEALEEATKAAREYILLGGKKDWIQALEKFRSDIASI